MRPEQFEFLRDLLKTRSGLVVTSDKMYLLETRLMPVARQHGCANLSELIERCRTRADHALEGQITDAMNTHESLFFRDNAPFELFRTTILPELQKRRAGQKAIRIWCAACSSGQEPYSLAMVLHDAAPQLAGWRTEIVATDISAPVLKRAEEGLFSQFEVQRGLPVQMLLKHFTKELDDWRLNKSIRDMVTFRPFNLLDDPRGLGKFDVVMCRNVLIYFDLPTKTEVLDRVSSVMAEDGVLFLGSAESTMGITERFCPVQAGRGVYKLTDGPACLVEG